ncbi:hypothetical protein M752DRAFT_262553 [Aspergillus phoenicis ATCC 13157]|uniref:Uncharacterized protein n=2 Tax=Aspergillus TaxID=5052 RepID=A0A370PVL8_ASPPH|nr:hypothetical protein M747DRAFT_307805 [Aspergillus niger ATCC 13496]RDK46231.1 hypothetical protein M752DRAFT_262553 [Aspergillus phoenicis ATCC 13157]
MSCSRSFNKSCENMGSCYNAFNNQGLCQSWIVVDVPSTEPRYCVCGACRTEGEWAVSTHVQDQLPWEMDNRVDADWLFDGYVDEDGAFLWKQRGKANWCDLSKILADP